MGGSVLGSVYEGSYDFGSILEAPGFWKLPLPSVAAEARLMSELLSKSSLRYVRDENFRPAKVREWSCSSFVQASHSSR